MEKFMLIFQGPIPPQLSHGEMQDNMGKWMAWNYKLAKQDQYLNRETPLTGSKKGS